MKSYPYIGQCCSAFVLFYAEGDGVILGDALGLDEGIQVGDKVRVHGATNITQQYLKNTWGAVESKEHAEFIVEVAKSAGLDIGACSKKGVSYFYTDDDYIGFTDSEVIASNRNEKQITIPLPPKEVLKNAGDNLIFGCEDSKCDEWPQVGDEVTFNDLLQHFDEYRDSYCDKVSRVIARFNSVEGEFITVHREYCAVMTVRVDRVLQGGALVKPKTPEEELRDDLINHISSCLTFIPGMLDKSDEVMQVSHQAACKLMAKYNITKKPQ